MDKYTPFSWEWERNAFKRPKGNTWCITFECDMSMRVEANKMRGISNIIYTGAELYKCVAFQDQIANMPIANEL